jgi:putative peptide zinc metalloprotease protein
MIDMDAWLRRLLLVVLLGLGASAWSGPAAAQEEGGGPDTAAVAINTKDGSTVFRVAFQIIRNPRDVVDNVNAAVAWSSCEACTTVAASFQVVLVTGDPSVVSPENYAIAVNYECTDCQTLASAYQYVRSTGGQVVFTEEGRLALAEIRQELRALMTNAESMTIFEIQAQLDALATRLAEVLANELVLIVPGLGLEIRREDVDEGVEPGEPTVTPSVDTGTGTGGTTTSPAPPESPPASESPSPSETESVSPSPTG